MKRFFPILPGILIFLSFSDFVFGQAIDPYKFIATLLFDDQYQDYLNSKKEQMFPLRFDFNTTQDGNNDGIIDVEDACENIVRYAVGDSIFGTGRTGISNRGPNDQRPAVYFHFIKRPDYDVYEYWLYYADNDYLNDHEHDWEKYYVYVIDSLPVYAMISSHSSFNLFSWNDLQKDDGHLIIGVDGGSHAMGNSTQAGVKIRYNGEVSKNSGELDVGDGQIFPWRIYSNDSTVTGSINYYQSPDSFLYGDPVYSGIPGISDNDEYGSPNDAPWKRSEWDDPPSIPLNIVSGNGENEIKIYPNPSKTDFTLLVHVSLLKRERQLDLILIDDLGREVKRISAIKNEYTTVSTGDLTKGFYVFRLLSKKKMIASGRLFID